LIAIENAERPWKATVMFKPKAAKPLSDQNKALSLPTQLVIGFTHLALARKGTGNPSPASGKSLTQFV
jgi:hypothetical protein